MIRAATISPCGRYRYSLARSWANEMIRTVPGGRVCWIMLNPSTADDKVDDPTIRKCIGFSKNWGYDSLEVVNLLAWRATHPRELRGEQDFVGPENAKAVTDAVARASLVVCAWGAADIVRAQGLGTHAAVHLHRSGVALHHLGLTKHGEPRHPLYVPYSVAPTRWAVL